MPGFLLIGIPIIVAVLLIGILTLPDDEKMEEKEESPVKPAKNVKKKKK